ncbi:hypothetical protein HUG17_6609 [Dermatophagoides farinae]|uniref:Uncharacterized protein n=1 Tax=Dermatophagoides farinae TaxID=6954 RepID=A0A9D4P5T2_DERFA|nr:hypothetical protein HUG17_6609 [Dermatophagoides farinae]
MDSGGLTWCRCICCQRRNLAPLEYRRQVTPDYAMWIQNHILYYGSNCSIFVLSHPNDGYFIPHHEVERPDAATTEIPNCIERVIGLEFDERFALEGESLNLNTLPHLVRIRMAPFLCIGDLQKAFLQIVDGESDRQYLRLPSGKILNDQ